jgi:outer membrane protein assembly factor BamD (BamD/ComL family)
MDSKFASSDSVLAGKPEERPEVPYRELVCAMLFIARYTRPDILYAVTVLCRYLTNYTTAHWKAAIRILVYLKGTTDIKLVYKDNQKRSQSNCTQILTTLVTSKPEDQHLVE